MSLRDQVALWIYCSLANSGRFTSQAELDEKVREHTNSFLNQHATEELRREAITAARSAAAGGGADPAGAV